MKNYRKIKVSKKIVRNKWSEKFVPSLLLSGEYMRDAGFKIGFDCSIQVEQGRITILAI